MSPKMKMQMIFQPIMKTKGVEVDPDAQTFRVKAASGGLMAMLGMGSKGSFAMDSNGFRLKKSSFSMDEDTYIPRDKIASTIFVVTKPMELLILGLATIALFGLGIIFLIAYLLAKKRVIVGIVSDAGEPESLKLKASTEQLEDIREGMRLVEDLIQIDAGASSERRSSSPPPALESRRSKSSSSSSSASESNGSFITSCPSCATQMNVPAAAAGRKVRCTSCREVFQVPAE
jgi:predicted Zn finger-like uncharacterized protein